MLEIIGPKFNKLRLSSIYFIDSNTGWAVGDDETIIKTTNGGNDWMYQN